MRMAVIEYSINGTVYVDNVPTGNVLVECGYAALNLTSTKYTDSDGKYSFKVFSRVAGPSYALGYFDAGCW